MSGIILSSFARGNVGTTGVASLQIGGLVGDNGGLIAESFAALGTVQAGANSQAGGLAGTNSMWDNNCGGCTHGDGYNLLAGLSFGGLNTHLPPNQFGFAVILDSHAKGNVSVGDFSLAGGLVGSTGNFNNSANGNAAIYQSWATGTVTGGGNSILGGLAGVQDIGAAIIGSTVDSKSYASGPVTSTGPNSIVGGFIGVNGGQISNSIRPAR